MKKEEYKKITVDGKEYKLGFPTRRDAKNAEKKGFNITDTNKLLTFTDKLFYVGLLSYHASMTEDEAEKIEEKFINEDGDINEVIKFLTDQFVAFINPQKN